MPHILSRDDFVYQYQVLRPYVAWLAKNPDKTLGFWLTNHYTGKPVSPSTFYRWVEQWGLNAKDKNGGPHMLSILGFLDEPVDFVVDQQYHGYRLEIERQAKQDERTVPFSKSDTVRGEKRRTQRHQDLVFERRLAEHADRFGEVEKTILDLRKENQGLREAVAATNARIDAMHDFLVEIGVIKEVA